MRIGLFARSLEGEGALQRSRTALLGIGSVRGAAVTLLVAGAALAGLAPRWLVGAPVVLGIAVAATHRRVPTVRAHLRGADAATLFGWAGLAAACRCASIGAALIGVGVPSPVSAAVIGSRAAWRST